MKLLKKHLKIKQLKNGSTRVGWIVKIKGREYSDYLTVTDPFRQTSRDPFWVEIKQLLEEQVTFIKEEVLKGKNRDGYLFSGKRKEEFLAKFK